MAFIEALIQNYPEGDWRTPEREQFINAIETIEREQENR